MLLRLTVFVALAAILICLFTTQPIVSQQLPVTYYCGDRNARPLANSTDGGSRTCGVKTKRGYHPKHKGLGFEILDSESEACFVPDQEYKLLDEIVDTVVKKVKYDRKLKTAKAKIDQARRISTEISNTLKARGFALLIPTDTLSDALINRNSPQEPERHVFDCDTGSLIFLTVAENLGAPVTLVDITLSSESTHNYVRWYIDEQTSFDWDMNGQSECLTPPNLPDYEGRSMSRSEILGYSLGLRESIWQILGNYESALGDYREAMRLYPQKHVYYNNLAWLIATKEIPNRKALQTEALKASEHAIAVTRTANYLDTLGCVYAYMGDFTNAIKIQNEAVNLAPNKNEFKERLKLFQDVPPKDCTGAK